MRKYPEAGAENRQNKETDWNNPKNIGCGSSRNLSRWELITNSPPEAGLLLWRETKHYHHTY